MYLEYFLLYSSTFREIILISVVNENLMQCLKGFIDDITNALARFQCNLQQFFSAVRDVFVVFFI